MVNGGELPPLEIFGPINIAPATPPRRIGRPLSVRDGKKFCAKCKVEKTVSQFHKDRSQTSGLQPYCKACRGVITADLAGYHRDYSLRRKYGISSEEFDEMEAEQDGRCAICTKVPTERLRADHNHATGKLRGLLCNECNFGLGKFGDSVELLSAAIAYLLGCQE